VACKKESGEFPDYAPTVQKQKRKTFTDEERNDITLRIDKGEPIKSVAINYKVSFTTIWRLYNRITG